MLFDKLLNRNKINWREPEKSHDLRQMEENSNRNISDSFPQIRKSDDGKNVQAYHAGTEQWYNLKLPPVMADYGTETWWERTKEKMQEREAEISTASSTHEIVIAE